MLTMASRKEIKNQGRKQVFSSKEVSIVQPLTREASCLYGSGTKWCTAAREDNYFDSYAERGVELVYILRKTVERTDPLYKMAMAIMPDQREEMIGEGSVLVEAYNSKDDRINPMKVKKIVQKVAGEEVWAKVALQYKLSTEVMVESMNMVRGYEEQQEREEFARRLHECDNLPEFDYLVDNFGIAPSHGGETVPEVLADWIEENPGLFECFMTRTGWGGKVMARLARNCSDEQLEELAEHPDMKKRFHVWEYLGRCPQEILRARILA